MIHVYGVVEGLRELPHVSGLDDAPLERRRVDGLELVVSRSDSEPAAEVSRDVILRHAEVVEELMHHSRSLLPAQLARTFVDEEEPPGACARSCGNRLSRRERTPSSGAWSECAAASSSVCA